MALLTVFDPQNSEPFEVRPHHAKHLVSLGWTLAPVDDVTPDANPQIAEVVVPDEHD
jgi:hypothetical protein